MSGSPPHEPTDEARGPGTAVDPASNTGLYPIQYPGLLPCPSSLLIVLLPLLITLSPPFPQPLPQKLPRSVAEAVPRAPRTRSPALLPQRPPARRLPRGNEAGPPRYASFLSHLPITSTRLIIRHTPPIHFPTPARRERLRMRLSILHPSVNAVVLPRTPSRTPMKTPITLSLLLLLLNLAPRRGRRGRVDLARSRTIDTNNQLPISKRLRSPKNG